MVASLALAAPYWPWTGRGRNDPPDQRCAAESPQPVGPADDLTALPTSLRDGAFFSRDASLTVTSALRRLSTLSQLGPQLRMARGPA